MIPAGFPGAGKNLNQHVEKKADKNRGMGRESFGMESDATVPEGEPPVSGSGAGVDDAKDTAGCEQSPERIERVLITQKFKLEFAVDPGFVEKLRRIQSFLSTKYPGGLSLEAVFDITMSEFLDRHSPLEKLERRNARREREQRKSALRDNKKRDFTENTENIVSDRDKHSARKSGDRCAGAKVPNCGKAPGEDNRCMELIGGESPWDESARRSSSEHEAGSRETKQAYPPGCQGRGIRAGRRSVYVHCR
jgi:hypothetical protein